ncbi:hypothetical protein OGAPHI_000284 [Ogataea philodendri]|uniref:Uncharacterized protein n=1 Tax=Ogataea philodendri TaxID=1378263 RepID=A0A9P8TA71_9ASCO|nr:uncharacterized protein OGAPHI_000284 [Ogataea philodendri]KAH3671581.1 hypothetical protein OGAPHI_000284 [Ogataea philodendri]
MKSRSYSHSLADTSDGDFEDSKMEFSTSSSTYKNEEVQTVTINSSTFPLDPIDSVENNGIRQFFICSYFSRSNSSYPSTSSMEYPNDVLNVSSNSGLSWSFMSSLTLFSFDNNRWIFSLVCTRMSILSIQRQWPLDW